MARDQAPKAGELFRVREGFAVPGADGFMRTFPVGALVDGGDPLAKSHKALMEPASSAVEKASAAPGERRVLGLRLPSGRSVAEVTEHRTGHAHENAAGTARVPTNVDEHEKESDMHALPPEHPDSPASTFAPDQPGRGVVADDVPTEEAAGAEKAADATVADAKAEGGNTKAARATAREAKAAAKADAERAEARQPSDGGKDN
jgi:hypothetical protein